MTVMFGIMVCVTGPVMFCEDVHDETVLCSPVSRNAMHIVEHPPTTQNVHELISICDIVKESVHRQLSKTAVHYADSDSDFSTCNSPLFYACPEPSIDVNRLDIPRHGCAISPSPGAGSEYFFTPSGGRFGFLVTDFHIASSRSVGSLSS
jgi:hypothetical protein